MPGKVPANPNVYHIIHVDRLASVIADKHLWCDSRMATKSGAGTTIGIGEIKQRRMTELTLESHPGLFIGECVPFYFCPRSVMLYILHKGNHPNLTYSGGQGPIIHLESNLRAAVAWAGTEDRRWAFTLSNAGAFGFEDRSKLTELGEINWTAVGANTWSGDLEHGKQAEFLVEHCFPWARVDRIGVHSAGIQSVVEKALKKASHKPPVEVRSDWYY